VSAALVGDGGGEAMSNVDHPKHYNAGKYEVIDVIEDWKLGFHLGNVVKYIARAEHKADALEDMKKARWYLNRAIELAESKVKL
jgi:hypothetical protein